MLCLPTGSSTSPWTEGSYGNLNPYYLVSSSDPGLQTKAVLSLLSTSNTAEWFAQFEHASHVQAMNYYVPRYWAPVFEAMTVAWYGWSDVQVSWNDLYCNSCGEWVHKSLDPDHHENICGDCQKHSEECDCCTKCGYSAEYCECCQTCGEAPNWCECCSYCQCQECECQECEDCGEKQQYCTCYSGSSSAYSFGVSKAAPWEARDDDPLSYTLPRISECRNNDIDPVMAAANFYLLDAIKNMVRFTDVTGASDTLQSDRAKLVQQDNMLAGLVTAANREYTRLVENLVPSFLAYSVSAVGGELRYHKAVSKSHLPSSRDKAWDKFVSIVETKGADTLFEADKLFNEFGSGSYGGKKWGDAAKVVGQYLRGNMPDWLFVDRVFTLQHNGGCFLNKLHWTKRNPRHWGLSHIQYVLNAHAGKDSNGNEAGTDWDLLLAIASPGIAQMFKMAERAINRTARRYGGYLVPVSKSKILRYA